MAAPAIREHPDLGRGLLMGLATGVAVALVAGLLRSILDLTAGLVALAALGGWAVGAAVRRGAWAGMPHRASRAPELLGLALGALAWIGTLVLAWVVAMAILPGSGRSLVDRLAGTPFLDWLGPQLGISEMLGLVLAAVLGWFGARSAPTTT